MTQGNKITNKQFKEEFIKLGAFRYHCQTTEEIKNTILAPSLSKGLYSFETPNEIYISFVIAGWSKEFAKGHSFQELYSELFYGRIPFSHTVKLDISQKRIFTFETEPSNKYDPYAIKCICLHKSSDITPSIVSLVGYIPASINVLIHRMYNLNKEPTVLPMEINSMYLGTVNNGKKYLRAVIKLNIEESLNRFNNILSYE